MGSYRVTYISLLRNARARYVFVLSLVASRHSFIPMGMFSPMTHVYMHVYRKDFGGKLDRQVSWPTAKFTSAPMNATLHPAVIIL